MLAAETRVLLDLDEPYPGLRAFEPDESLLFFGRRAHTEALLERLCQCRFLAVVGTSGSGKSSLVKAGLVPALRRGHLGGAGSRWRIALTRPGESPIGKLAEALAEAAPAAGTAAQIGKTLERSSLGLVQAVRESGLAPSENLLLVVDQFEEIFRFRGARRRPEREEDAALFVSSILEAVGQLAVPIYVVLTMRSDFLGDCARFHGLPEALNRSQYLVPQLTRRERQEAIEGPLRVVGAPVDPALVQRVLNDAGDEPDRLPVLQHALMRTFRAWKDRGGAGRIGLEHYEAAGSVAEALDRHASEVYESLPDPEHRAATEKVFRCLTTVENGRAVRRPTSLERIFAVSGASDEPSRERVRAVIRRFAARENSFLLSSTGMELGPGTIVDISHESLIARWTLLGAWVMQEVKVADCYRYLSRDAALYPVAAGLWRDPELAGALQHFESGECNEAWSKQYDDGSHASFAETLRFLEESRRVQREEIEREELRRRKEIEDARKLAAAEARARRWLGRAAVLLFLLLLTTGGSFWLYGRWVRAREAERDQTLLREQLASAQTQADDARKRIATLESAGGESAAEIERLRKQVQQSEMEIRRARADLEGGKQQQVDRRAEDLIRSLQDQLAVARKERDTAYANAEQAMKRAPQYGSGSTSDELEAANRRIELLESKLASARPAPLVLPEHSLAPLIRGRASAMVGGLSLARKGAAPSILVFVGASPGNLPRSFESDPKLAAELSRSTNLECPGVSDTRGGSIYCFPLPASVASRPEEIGRFWVGKEEMILIAMGIGGRTEGAGGLMVSLVAFDAPPAAVKAKR